MNSIDFEKDNSIIVKTHSLKLKRNNKNISIILIYHVSYEAIEIKIIDSSSTKLLGREVFTYSDIFEHFENYFICFNENMFNIYTFINNCFVLKKYKVNIKDKAKQIIIELFILKDCELNILKINIAHYQNSNEYNKVLEKIKELNLSLDSFKGKNYKVAPVNYIKYENNVHNLYFEIFMEKEINVLGIKAQVIHKKDEDIINNSKDINNLFYASYYSYEEFNITTENYYHSIVNLEEISKEILINFYNKNIKIERITEKKVKLKMKVVSLLVNTIDLDIILLKGADIKVKYLEIIGSLKMQNEYLIKREIYQSELNEEKNKINNSNILDEYTLSNDSNYIYIGNSLANSNISLEKKLLCKKINRNELDSSDNSKKGKKKDKNPDKGNNKKRNENKSKKLNDSENVNQNNINELYQQLIKSERKRLANISEQLDESDY